MKVEIKVPVMGESVSEAKVSTILKATGSAVKEDEEIVELETEKVNQVLYAPKSGVITLQVQVDQTVKIGQVIGFIDTQAQGQETTPNIRAQKSSPAENEKPVSTPPPPSSSEGARKTVGDFVSSLKQEASSPAMPQKPEAVPQLLKAREGTSRKRMSGLRKVIAERLVQAKNTTAMLTTFNEIDMSSIIEIRSREKDNFTKKYGVKL
jgi:2-oxoglutarate dehydrogenase E2 component (dihydrolipoamide succinyltransferase)